eukprot:9574840-Alexandrium_andersonii.AAC.1
MVVDGVEFMQIVPGPWARVVEQGRCDPLAHKDDAPYPVGPDFSAHAWLTLEQWHEAAHAFFATAESVVQAFSSSRA